MARGYGRAVLPKIGGQSYPIFRRDYITHHHLPSIIVTLPPPLNNQYAKHSEISNVCRNHAELLTMLDGIFADVHIRRGKVTAARIIMLEESFLTFMKEWQRMEMSETPRFHTFVDHVVENFQRTQGYAVMREYWIDHYHQIIERHYARVARLRNKNEIVDSLTKFQEVNLRRELKSIQHSVHNKTKRNNTARKVQLKG